MTLVYSYSPESARKQLDLNEPMGKAIAKHRMQVMYPFAQLAAGDLTTTDWSQVGALEQPIYNPGDETITVLISLEDTAKGWWQRSVEVPPRVPMLLRVPMDEARLSIDPGHVQRWLLWEADPPAAVQFRLGTPLLAPAGKSP